jgi:hypothetical protein
LIEATGGEVKAAEAFLQDANRIDETADITGAQESLLKEIRSLLKDEGDTERVGNEIE